MKTTEFMTIRFSSGEQYIIRRDLLEKLYRDKSGGGDETGVGDEAIPSDAREFLKRCREKLTWLSVKDIAQKLEANEMFEWSRGTFEMVKTEEAKIPGVHVNTHLEVTFPNSARYTFKIDLLCVALADISVRDEGIAFPFADALYTHLVGEANSLIGNPEYVIEQLKDHWPGLSALAETIIPENENNADYHSWLLEGSADIQLLGSEIDENEAASMEISMDTIPSLREQVRDVVWGQ